MVSPNPLDGRVLEPYHDRVTPRAARTPTVAAHDTGRAWALSIGLCRNRRLHFLPPHRTIDSMKSQYFGDLTDYRKYGLLRCLSANGEIKTGVCWMLTEGVGWVSTEHETEGASKFQYLTEPEQWRHFDPDLFDSCEHKLRRIDEVL